MSLLDTRLVVTSFRNWHTDPESFSSVKHTYYTGHICCFSRRRGFHSRVVTFLQRFNSFLFEDRGWSSLAGILLQPCSQNLGCERPTVRRDLSQRRRLVGNLKASQPKRPDQSLECHKEWIAQGKKKYIYIYLQVQSAGVVSCPGLAAVEHVQKHTAAAPHICFGSTGISVHDLRGHVRLRSFQLCIELHQGEKWRWADGIFFFFFKQPPFCLSFSPLDLLRLWPSLSSFSAWPKSHRKVSLPSSDSNTLSAAGRQTNKQTDRKTDRVSESKARFNFGNQIGHLICLEWSETGQQHKSVNPRTYWVRERQLPD